MELEPDSFQTRCTKHYISSICICALKHKGAKTVRYARMARATIQSLAVQEETILLCSKEMYVTLQQQFVRLFGTSCEEVDFG